MSFCSFNCDEIHLHIVYSSSVSQQMKTLYFGGNLVLDMVLREGRNIYSFVCMPEPRVPLLSLSSSRNRVHLDEVGWEQC